MITSARLRENLKPASGIEWITALRAPAIKKLASEGVLQLSLFDTQDLAEITHPDFPGCLTALGAASRHHVVSLCWVQTAAHGDF